MTNSRWSAIAGSVKRLGGIACTVLILCAAAFAADDAEPGVNVELLSKIPARMQEHVKAGEFSGVVTLVAQNGKVLHTNAVGMQNMEENRPMREDSIFQIMSMTKPITGVAIMILVDEGRISLYDEVQKYLPEFKNQKLNVNGWMKTPPRPIQIHDLMSHTSGMRMQPQGPMKDLYHQLDHTLAEAVTEFAREPLEFEPGTKWLYSNMGIATLGRIIEVVTGQSYESFIESRILGPLQMKDTFFYPPADKLQRIAIVYERKGTKLVPAAPETLGGDPRNFRKGAKYPAPEFGLFSTAQDLSHFYQMMLDRGTWNGVRVISPAAVSTMIEVQTAGMQAGWHQGADYGLTWEIISKPLGTMTLLPLGSYGHGGAFGTHGWVIPKRNMVTVFLVGCGGEECNSTTEDAFQQIVGASMTQ